MTRRQAISQLTAPGQDLELVELETRHGARCRVFRNAPSSLRELSQAAAFGEYTHLVYRQERYSFAETRLRAARLAWLLRERYGIERGDCVAVCMRNYPEWIFAYEAIVSLGAVIAALNAWWSESELEYGLKDCGARLLIADQERVERIAGRLDELDLPALAVRSEQTFGPRVAHYEAEIKRFDQTDFPPAEIDPDDDATIYYTSGSTGHPKGAVSTHRNVIHAILSWELDGLAAALVEGVTPPKEPEEFQAKLLLSVPLFHVTGSHVSFLSGLRAGRMLALMHRWDVVEAMDTIEREQITGFVSVPTITGDLVRAAAEHGRKLPSLLAVGGGGGPRPAQQVRSIAETFENALPVTGWGMTETNAIGVGIRGSDYLQRPTSSGRCSAVLDIKIVDEGGAEVPVGERGELLIRGTSVVRGYWNKPEETAAAFQDGWMRTGDVAKIDQDGFVYIVDRIKDIVIRGGENISCLDVEDALYECDQVEEAVVFGVPDERLGEELAAAVKLRSGCGATVEDLQQALAGRVAKFEIPALIYFQDEPLPRIASGKFAKRAIRDEIVAQRRAARPIAERR